MRKILTILASLALVLAVATSVNAEETNVSVASKTGNSSATVSQLRISSADNAIARKKQAMKNVLERYNSPLTGTVDDFIAACVKYDIDCYILPSIAGVESTFGKFYIKGTYNVFGWGRGNIPFESWNDSYMTIAGGLRKNYINKGALDIDAIGAIYCEGDTWSGKVKYFMNEFQKEEANLSL